MSKVAGTKYVNLSRKYRIDRDDFEAQFERLTRYILATYNFGSEMVVLAYLDLIRHGDIAAETSANKVSGKYRREKGEEVEQAAKNAIAMPSEIIAAALKEKEEAAIAREAQAKAEKTKKKKEKAEGQIAGQIALAILDEEGEAERARKEAGEKEGFNAGESAAAK